MLIGCMTMGIDDYHNLGHNGQVKSCSFRQCAAGSIESDGKESYNGKH